MQQGVAGIFVYRLTQKITSMTARLSPPNSKPSHNINTHHKISSKNLAVLTSLTKKPNDSCGTGSLKGICHHCIHHPSIALYEES